MNVETIFMDIGAVVVLATVCAFVARMFKQPLIPAYILAGIILGPIIGVIQNQEIIHSMSEIGVAFLLFIVGLEMDIRKLWNVGPVSVVGGLTQVTAIFGLTFILASFFGFSPIVAIYFGLMVTLSSTMVVIKLLSDNKEIDTLHGRIIIGILIVQDIVAIIALTVLASITDFSVQSFAFSLLTAVLCLGVLVAVGKLVFPRLFNYAASSQELLFVGTVSVAFLFAMIFQGLGFSLAIGAFVAGLLLAGLPYSTEMMGKVKPLRDFFSVIFFVSLGMQIIPGTVLMFVVPLVAFTLIALLIKPLVIMTVTSFFGYKKRTAFLAGFSLGQISEFSLIIAAIGASLGHLSKEMLSLVITVAVLTILLTTYTFPLLPKVFRRYEKQLQPLDKLTGEYKELAYLPKIRKNHIILCGYNRIGYNIMRKLKKLKMQYFVVDYNPEVIKHLIKKKIPCTYGDVSDEEVLECAHLNKATMVISTVPDKEDSMLLIKRAKAANKDMIVIVTSNHVEEALDLYKRGADYVVLPHILGGDHVSLLLENFKDNFKKLIDNRLGHITDLKRHHKVRHSHERNYFTS